MSEPLKFTMLVEYVGGGHEKFEVEVQAEEVPVVSKIDQTMKAGVLAMETGDGLVTIPMSSIKRVTITPVPPKLPAYVVRNARRVE
jgi:hypothetical protein